MVYSGDPIPELRLDGPTDQECVNQAVQEVELQPTTGIGPLDSRSKL